MEIDKNMYGALVVRRIITTTIPNGIKTAWQTQTT